MNDNDTFYATRCPWRLGFIPIDASGKVSFIRQASATGQGLGEVIATAAVLTRPWRAVLVMNPRDPDSLEGDEVSRDGYRH